MLVVFVAIGCATNESDEVKAGFKLPIWETCVSNTSCTCNSLQRNSSPGRRDAKESKQNNAKWNIRRRVNIICVAKNKKLSCIATSRLSFCSETPYEANLRLGDCKNTTWFSLRMLEYMRVLHSFHLIFNLHCPPSAVPQGLCHSTPRMSNVKHTFKKLHKNSETWIVKYISCQTRAIVHIVRRNGHLAILHLLTLLNIKAKNGCTQKTGPTAPRSWCLSNGLCSPRSKHFSNPSILQVFALHRIGC